MGPSREASRGDGQSSSQASQASPSQSKDAALEAAISAAESAMDALKLATDPAEKSRLSAKVKELLARAETVKLGVRSSTSNSATAASAEQAGGRPDEASRGQKALRQPCSTRVLSKGEQILLLKSSYLHGFKFPPWTTPPDPDEFARKDGEDLFLDTPELSLSEYQEDLLDDWMRPSDALPPPSWSKGAVAKTGVASPLVQKVDLVQDAATDCSVVASLSAAVARLESGRHQSTGAMLYPDVAHPTAPQLSGNGKYIARLNFNGCYRKVMIDDRLPTSATSQIIHVVDRNNPALLWPALAEKAYLKVRGGYDFPGSNSGTDLWILLGWIPEQIFLQCGDFDAARLWDRVSHAFGFGDVLVTMGTGKMSSSTERDLGLASEHDYAVLDVRELNGQRLFLIKNPWCEGTSWRRIQGPADDVHDAEAEHARDRPRNDESDGRASVECPRDLLNANKQLSPGTFWMDLYNVVQYFESIYLNWNPGLFAVRQDLHFAWDLSPHQDGGIKPRGPYASFREHPQYTVSVSKSGIVWMLLCRHFQNAVPADATPEEIEADRYGIELKGHISLQAFSSNGHRVLLPDRAVEQGWYVDSPQTLLKLDCSAGEALTLVPTEQELPATKQTFTLSAFSNASVTLAEAKEPYQHCLTTSGMWAKDTAGGNAHSPTYSTNPQFSIALSEPTNISLLLQTSDDKLNVHIKLVHSSRGQRIHSIRNRDIVFDSKDYRRGFCVAESGSPLEAGRYTMICSTFEADQLGDFSFTVQSTQPVQVTSLPKEGAGRTCLNLGTMVFRQAQRKMVAPLEAGRLVNFYAVARPVQGSPEANRPLVRLSLQRGREPNLSILVASNDGEYSASMGGWRTEPLDIGPDPRRVNQTWVVVERLSAGSSESEETLSVGLFVDHPGALTWGEWRPWDD